MIEVLAETEVEPLGIVRIDGEAGDAVMGIVAIGVAVNNEVGFTLGDLEAGGIGETKDVPPCRRVKVTIFVKKQVGAGLESFVKNGAFVVDSVAVGIFEDVDAIFLRANIVFRALMGVIFLNEDPAVRSHGNAGRSDNVRCSGKQSDLVDVRVVDREFFCQCR